MTATILQFPKRAIDAERLALVGDLISKAVPIATRDMELNMLLTTGGKLIDYQAMYVSPVRLGTPAGTKAERGWEVA